jgi:hypothetical protein
MNAIEIAIWQALPDLSQVLARRHSRADPADTPGDPSDNDPRPRSARSARLAVVSCPVLLLLRLLSSFGFCSLSQSRKLPRKALALSPTRHFGGSVVSRFALPPPSTTSSGSSAAISCATASATQRFHSWRPERSRLANVQQLQSSCWHRQVLQRNGWPISESVCGRPSTRGNRKTRKNLLITGPTDDQADSKLLAAVLVLVRKHSVFGGIPSLGSLSDLLFK